MMARNLAGKVALVTGGSAGIGLGLAKCFAEEGARVFIIGRRQSELDKAVTAIGGHTTAVQGDTSNLGDLDRIFATIKDQAGHIDVLAVNAGYYEFGSFGEITEEHFDRTFNTNVRGLLVYGAEGAAAAGGRSVSDPHRLDYLDQRFPVLLGIQRQQGRGAVLRS